MDRKTDTYTIITHDNGQSEIRGDRAGLQRIRDAIDYVLRSGARGSEDVPGIVITREGDDD
jgi:hypothetical protein